MYVDWPPTLQKNREFGKRGWLIVSVIPGFLLSHVIHLSWHWTIHMSCGHLCSERVTLTICFLIWRSYTGTHCPFFMKPRFLLKEHWFSSGLWKILLPCFQGRSQKWLVWLRKLMWVRFHIYGWKQCSMLSLSVGIAVMAHIGNLLLVHACLLTCILTLLLSNVERIPQVGMNNLH